MAIQLGQVKVLIALLVLTVPCIQADVNKVSSALVAGITQPAQYDVKTDDTHQGMDCLKIAVDPYTSTIFGVFHRGNQQTKYSELYVAKRDQQTKRWVNTVKISQRGSQGSIFVLNEDNGIMVVYELQNHEHGNRIALRYYDSVEKLFRNSYWYEYQLSAKIGDKNVRNVGTPDIEQADLTFREYVKQHYEYSVTIKFHYSPDGSHDFPGQGIVNVKPLRDFTKYGQWVGGSVENYQDWRGTADTVAEGILRQAGCGGKIGQRDYFFVGGERYYLYQCNLYSDFDWRNWRIFVVSQTEKKATMLPLHLDGVIDFANPHITLMQSSGQKLQFAVTLFVPSQAITPSSTAKPGECIFMTTIDQN